MRVVGRLFTPYFVIFPILNLVSLLHILGKIFSKYTGHKKIKIKKCWKGHDKLRNQENFKIISKYSDSYKRNT